MNLMGQGVAQQIKVHVAKLNGLSLIPPGTTYWKKTNT